MAQSKTVNKAVKETQKAKIKADSEVIQDDVKTLKKDVGSYMSSKWDDGRNAASDLRDSAQDNLVQLQNYGRDQMKNVEEEIRERPGRSIAIAAGLGVLAGMFFSRRR